MPLAQKARSLPFFNRFEKLAFPGWAYRRRVRVTVSGWIYTGLVFFFGFAAINTGNNLLYLILSVMIGLLVASFWISEMSLSESEITRDPPEIVNAGDEFLVTYRLANHRRFWPNCGIEVSEKLGDKEILAFFALVRPRVTDETYARACLNRRGRYEFGEVLMCTYFPFGMFMKGKSLTIPGSLVVLPSAIPAELDAAAGGDQMGTVLPGSKGMGTELYGFREYVHGDHPHWIDWKASARSNQMLVMETERDSEQSVILDLRVARRRPEPDSLGRENLIRRAYGLARHFIDQGWRVRVQVEDRGVDFGTGLDQLKKIAFFLALFDDRNDPFLGDKLTATQFPAQKIELAEK